MSNTQGGSVDAKAGQNAGQSSGLFAALKNISVTLLTTGKTRLELLGNELEEEKQRAVRLVLMAQGMVFCFGVGALLFVAFVTLLFWESRIAILGAFVAVFLLSGGAFYVAFGRLATRPTPVFSASLAELQEDLRELKASIPAHLSTRDESATR
jgi:uncharacterized membrane protein YqjE